MMASFLLLGSSTWRKTPAACEFNPSEWVYYENGAVRHFSYSDIRKVQVSYHIDWKLGRYIRCDVHLDGHRRVRVYSDVISESRTVLYEFFSELIKRVAKVNPKVKIRFGIDHVNWAVLFSIHLGLAVLLVAVMWGAPREAISSSVVAVLALVPLSVSAISMLSNWPRHYNYTESAVQGLRGQALHGYLADQYERFVSPIVHLTVFVLNPSSLAPNITSRDKKSFKLALGGVGLSLFFFTAAGHILVWENMFERELAFYETLTIDALFLIIPSACFIGSFLLLRTAFRYDELSPLE